MNEAPFEKRGAVALVALTNPPVNALGHAVREHLASCLDAVEADASIEAVVLYGDGASAPRLMLHAARLTLEIGGRVTTLRCPAAPAFD